MFTKTTSHLFQKYGTILHDYNKPKFSRMHCTELKIKNKNINNYFTFDKDVIIKKKEGIVLIIVAKDANNNEHEEFVIHRTLKLKAGFAFNFITITDLSKVEIITDKVAKKKIIPTFSKQTITYNRITPKIHINEIYAYYYQVSNPGYNFPGESHDMWELTFVDNGELETSIDKQSFHLSSMDMILYAPNEFHSQKILESKPCSYLTIMFDMECSHPELINKRVFNANRDLHHILNNIVKTSNVNLYYDTELMLCYLKELIIKLFQYDFLNYAQVATTPMQQKFENELLNEVILYINENIYTSLTIEEICHQFSISRSSLQSLFKNNLDIAPKQYISDLKLNKSKLLIKESIYTISEISNKLGFASIHYFSRKFKQQFGITPTDYAKTIYK